jgi:hypothetical protein
VKRLASLVVFVLWGCAAAPPPSDFVAVEELALTEPPYFPKCVARESGTYHQRKIDRHMWWPLSFEVDYSEPITDECVLTRP